MTTNDDRLAAKPAAAKIPLHPSITDAQIALLVERFYDGVWAHPRLGPIFSAHITDRAAHLATMTRFWSSVLWKTGTYHGRPVPAHVQLTEVTEDDFPIWLGLFREACTATFEPEAAVLVIKAAENIARSLWLAMFGRLDRLQPSWS